MLHAILVCVVHSLQCRGMPLVMIGASLWLKVYSQLLKLLYFALHRRKHRRTHTQAHRAICRQPHNHARLASNSKTLTPDKEQALKIAYRLYSPTPTEDWLRFVRGQSASDVQAAQAGTQVALASRLMDLFLDLLYWAVWPADETLPFKCFYPNRFLLL